MWGLTWCLMDPNSRRSSPKILAGAARKGKVAASLVVLGVAGRLPAAWRQRAPAVGSGVAERCGNGWRHGAARTGNNGWRRDGLEHGGGALRRWSTLVNSPASLRPTSPTNSSSTRAASRRCLGRCRAARGRGRSTRVPLLSSCRFFHLPALPLVPESRR